MAEDVEVFLEHLGVVFVAVVVFGAFFALGERGQMEVAEDFGCVRFG